MSKRPPNKTISPTSARACARSAPSSPANIGARSIASAPIRRNSSRRSPRPAISPRSSRRNLAAAGSASAPPPRSWKKCTPPAATAPPATPRCTPWARSCGTARAEQKKIYLPKIASGELRLQAFGVTEPTSGTDTLSLAHHRAARGQRSLRHQRPEDLDLARRAFRSDAAARAHHAARKRPRNAPTVSRCSWSTCGWPRTPASPSIRSAP